MRPHDTPVIKLPSGWDRLHLWPNLLPTQAPSCSANVILKHTSDTV